MSVICQNFVQNTWRKDLCSNCFKSVSDHTEDGHRNIGQPGQRYIPQATSLYQSRVLSPNFQWRTFLIDPPATRYSEPFYSNRSYDSRTSDNLSITPDKTDMGKSILKLPSSKKSKSANVGFASEEPLVIGYGGNDYDSDDSPWEMASDDGSVSIELLDATDEDRNMTRITKDNTEFNSVNDNLISSPVSKDTTNNLSNMSQGENYGNNYNLGIDENRACSKTRNTVSEDPDNSTDKSDKKLDYYYFSTKDETKPALRKFAEKLSNSPKVNSYIFNNLNNRSSVAAFDSKVEKLNEKNIRNANLLFSDESQNGKGKEYSPYPSMNHSLPKVNNCDPSSDSDYSTSRQTTGESSTDSESLHEGEEPAVLPCSSFLHGSADRYRVPNILRKLSTDEKPYDAASSSSCNLSTISSDESDSPMRAEVPASEHASDIKEKEVEIIQCGNNNATAECSDGKNNEISSESSFTSEYSGQVLQDETNFRSRSPEAVLENRQEVITECRNWLPANDEWQSYQFVPKPSPSSSRSSEALSLQNIEDEVKQEPVSNVSSCRTHPDSRKNRQTKLAALALELEQARCDPSPHESPSLQFFTPENNPKTNFRDSSTTTDTPLSSTGKIFKSGSCSSIENASKHLLIDSINPSSKLPYQSSRLSSMPDLLPDTPQKLKKGKFSLKKLLKRNKDSEPVTPTHGEHNLKAWKRHHFDRSRLSLEIVHPIDLTSDPPTSTESTPTEENRHSSIFMDPSGRGARSTQRARSLSALPHLMSTPTSDTPEYRSQGETISASLDRSKKDGNACRKASTVAERGKKTKAPTRTPSCSALHSSSLGSSGNSTPSGVGSQRPPKPPPPPRGKSLSPATQPQRPSQGPVKSGVPARPPPPKVSEGKENYFSPPSKDSSPSLERQCSSSGQYANLGDIRSHLAPKKPQRLSLVQCKKGQKDEDRNNSGSDRDGDNTYETLEATEEEEEDHYTYLDELEAKSSRSKLPPQADGQISDPARTRCSSAQETEEEKPGSRSTPTGPSTTNSDGKPPRRPPDPKPIHCALRATPERKRPWFDLQASYIAIAAANYESLAELISAALGEEVEPFQKTSSSLQWSDFDIETEKPVQVLEDKVIYNAIYNHYPKIKVTLMVTTQKQHTSQSCRNQARPPVLASFNDYIPRYYLSTTENHCTHSDVTKAMIYVLQRSKTTTVNQFSHDSSSHKTNQHIHLRNACFVLLQLIYTLKNLQVDGIEEIDYDLSRIFLINTDSEKPPILVLLPGDKIYLTMIDFFKSDSSTRRSTLCQATLQLMFHLLQIDHPGDLHNCVVNGEQLADPIVQTFAAVAKVLSEEKASSLSQAKGLLEYMLWGPVDVISGSRSGEENVDTILQRWLDLQRAQMVKSLVSSMHIKATTKGLKDIILKL